MFTTNKKSGFTLVEMVVYAAGVILLVGAIVAALYYSYVWYENITVGLRVDQTALALSGRLLGSIRSGAAVNLTQSALNTADGALYINISATTTAYSDYFALQSGRVVYRKNGGSTTFLTPGNITVSKLFFTQLNTPKSQAVKFDIDIPYSTRQGTITRSYTGFAVLRQSYQ